MPDLNLSADRSSFESADLNHVGNLLGPGVSNELIGDRQDIRKQLPNSDDQCVGGRLINLTSEQSPISKIASLLWGIGYPASKLILKHNRIGNHLCCVPSSSTLWILAQYFIRCGDNHARRRARTEKRVDEMRTNNFWWISRSFTKQVIRTDQRVYLIFDRKVFVSLISQFGGTLPQTLCSSHSCLPIGRGQLLGQPAESDESHCSGQYIAQKTLIAVDPKFSARKHDVSHRLRRLQKQKRITRILDENVNDCPKYCGTKAQEDNQQRTTSQNPEKKLANYSNFIGHSAPRLLSSDYRLDFRCLAIGVGPAHG